jgi:hypothetical protein
LKKPGQSDVSWGGGIRESAGQAFYLGVDREPTLLEASRGIRPALIESGARFHKAQSSRLAGKLADMRRALDARRGSLTHLTDLATSLVRDAGHNPTPDTIHSTRQVRNEQDSYPQITPITQDELQFQSNP